VNQYNEWGPDGPAYQPAPRPPRSTGYGPPDSIDTDGSYDYRSYEPTDEQLAQADAMARRRRTNRRTLKIFGCIAVGVLAVILLVGLLAPKPVTTTVVPLPPAPTAVALPNVPPAKIVPPKAEASRLAPGVFGDGTYEVGTGPGLIEPGRYRYDGGAAVAYWARARDTSGETSAIIANGMPKGPTTITIKKTDGAVIFQGDATWHKI